MALDIVSKMDREAAKEGAVGAFRVGDNVRVHVKIREGDKERVQIFSGTVISRRGTAGNATFTVRRVSHGVGVERVFPVHSPYIAKLDVESSSRVRRAKLGFMRARSGKQSRLKEAHRSSE